MPSTTTRHTISRERQRLQRSLGQSAAKGGRVGKAAPQRGASAQPARTSAPRTVHPGRLLIALCALTLLLGAFAGWSHARAHSLTHTSATRNTALTDPARTSQVKGRAEKAVNALFSYDYANPQSNEKATATLLTGKAVDQHRTLLAPVLTRAKKQKTVVTTTVTDSAVERIDGDRARVLVYADQSSTSTAAKTKAGSAANYGGAMLAVDLVLKNGHWLVSAIDTFSS
ncbi:hypothetical protein [Streptomyces sp. VRA16 Mangrove soil]|uniref:hypothetical protein n=1 Tax=Streptomyces sp. VRA16 Mangrove soil TaxID=2817434 RepID=UPI001A9DB668|nr:hypothetical protein [Streptomyces sp. VRA16 Mangrove soil]MBO1333130.1 hypothetical protein [Streptomyces sp. VRA16 Mangrove soil]